MVAHTYQTDMCDQPNTHATSIRCMAELAAIAYSWGKGCVFGSFARDVVGMIINEKKPTSCPNVLELYFKEESHEGNYRHRCDTAGYIFGLKMSEANGPIVNRSYYVTCHRENIAFIVRTTVCDVFPSDIFDVNRVMYGYSCGDWIDQNDADVQKAIKNKEATMMIVFDDNISDAEKFYRIHHEFFDKGWKVYFYDRAGNKYELLQQTTYAVFCCFLQNNVPAVGANPPSYSVVGPLPLPKFIPAPKKTDAVVFQDKATTDRIKQLESELAAMAAIVVQLKSILQ